MFLVGEGDSALWARRHQRCETPWGMGKETAKMRKDAQGCHLPSSTLHLWATCMSFLAVTCDAARGLHCPKETCKRCTQNRSTSFKPTRKQVDCTSSIFRTFCCGKTIHASQGTQWSTPVSKFATMMTGIFLRKWLSFERWKSFERLGCVANPLGRTKLQDKKGCD